MHENRYEGVKLVKEELQKLLTDVQTGNVSDAADIVDRLSALSTNLDVVFNTLEELVASNKAMCDNLKLQTASVKSRLCEIIKSI